jgi:hypothetical protein
MPADDLEPRSFADGYADGLLEGQEYASSSARMKRIADDLNSDAEVVRELGRLELVSAFADSNYLFAAAQHLAARHGVELPESETSRELYTAEGPVAFDGRMRLVSLGGVSAEVVQAQIAEANANLDARKSP